MTRSLQAVAYTRPSVLESVAGGHRLGLETSRGATPTGVEDHPRFFTGFLASPQVAAAGLLAVADVAAARYYQQQLRASLDPVVTGNGDRLRFESFSGCGGVYARLDVLEPGLDGGEVGHGTTNVDVNNPLREALSRVGSDDPLHLRVGPDELAVTTLDGPVVEKKVPLPDRWLRGFAEAQVIAAGFDLRAELPAAEAVRFLRSLPRGGSRGASRGAQWVVPAGRGLRPTTRPVPGAVCLPGPERLVALQRVLRHATALRVYGPPAGGTAALASAWEVVLPGMRLTLTLSPEAARGFSGEGGVLDALATDEVAEDAELIAVLLAWEPRIDIGDLAAASGLPTERVRAALTRLGTSGRVGYDTAEAAYFHRELPYDADRVERHNPRLRSARALVAAGAVTLDGGLGTVTAEDGHVHRVRDQAGTLSCSCLWWAKYRGGRGPCKHALAVRMVRRGAKAESDGTPISGRPDAIRDDAELGGDGSTGVRER
ncbi:SWIM zinc finger family protein [Streptomyces ipomoeae]|uniref:SWIM zinc finger family protein n=1 Tax=Streptomyces ipomoeae TaxID=103232 RepID=A0AAE9AYY6_9ACTN|nr:SWIM zinc finger family protein [Streptomyces ipomoeae]MDX2694744.1 SWIM zinc finger domain-containing protein [Streptomyces ipomoeae]MDX2840570.1 SWIM zinc finger domain-containing protein [Streptomyces ipomoeae]TQE30440.1 SWIM zinc finger family protein [Streptomyces ipomoeae]